MGPMNCFSGNWQRQFVCFGFDSLGSVEDVGPRGAMVAHQTSDLGVAGSSPAVVISSGADGHSRDLSRGGLLYIFCWLLVVGVVLVAIGVCFWSAFLFVGGGGRVLRRLWQLRFILTFAWAANEANKHKPIAKEAQPMANPNPTPKKQINPDK